jgi:hypothetical protein
MTHGLISREIGSLIRPVAKVFKELADIVNASPWSHLGRTRSPRSAQTPQSSFAMVAVVASQAAASNSSPYMASLPPTPLSAALGPAAQATVPLATASTTTTTTASASRNGLFSGNVFERADSLLSAPSRSMTLVGTPGGIGASSGSITTIITGANTASASSAAANHSNIASSSHPHHNLVTPTVISPLGTRINHRAF